MRTPILDASMADGFLGRSLALSRAGLVAEANALSVDLPEIWAVVAVETSGCGFLANRRPQILYERHLFHRLTLGRFDDGNISDPTPGGYGPPGVHQYDRLDLAIQLDRTAALMSTSWGLGQILGANHAMSGYADVEGFVSAMTDSEDLQLAAVTAFLRATGLGVSLQHHNWTDFARGYNGPSFAKNRYDVRLAGEYQKAAAGALPDLTIRTAQLYLRYRGYDVGAVDGVLGPHTRSAIEAFQVAEGLPQTGEVDNALLVRLMPT